MNRNRAPWSWVLLIAFSLRALVPLGLMLQLPNAAAGVGNEFGFVICPVQNPGIDLSRLQSRTDQHAEHHHHQDNGSAPTVAVGHETPLCSLWSNGPEISLAAAIDVSLQLPPVVRQVTQPVNEPFSSNAYRTPRSRAPPHNLN